MDLQKIDKCQKSQLRFEELEGLLADCEVMADQDRYQSLAKEYSKLTPLITIFKEYRDLSKYLIEAKKIVKTHTDNEFVELARLEVEELQESYNEVLIKLEAILNPKIEEQDHNLIFEVRAGTGGEEASLFAADLYRMYTKYCDKRSWRMEVISFNESETGGFKEIIFSIQGEGASRSLKFESGVHRVQRVPTTETSGRIHTSAATVAVLFEPEEVDLEIDPQDLRIDIFRSSGPGGQSVNTTDSAVRITHEPTGIVVSCQDERSQLKNKGKAMRVLRARLLDKMQQEAMQSQAQDRKLKVGSGDRSEKIRTYNFPDRRITDHRIGFTSHKLNYIMDGECDELMEALIKANQETGDNNDG